MTSPGAGAVEGVAQLVKELPWTSASVQPATSGAPALPVLPGLRSPW
jgi:hypothetical protein